MSSFRPPRRASRVDPIRQLTPAGAAALAVGRACIVLFTAFICFRFARYTLARPVYISDDEGYLLLTLKHYFAGEHLYTQVFSQYGPFYFLIQKAIFGALHLPVSYDAGREVFLGYWLLAALLAGIFIHRLSKNVTLASAAALALLWLERSIAYEPNHPQQMALVLMMAGCVLSVKPNRASLLTLGAIGAALFWTKSNVGIFFLTAALIASVCVLPPGRLRTLGRDLLPFITMLGPLLLMHDYFMRWSWRFFLLTAIAGTATVLVALDAQVHGPARLRPLRMLLCGTVAGIVAVPFIAQFAGIPLRGVWDSVLVGSLRQATVFSLPIGLKITILAAAMLLAVLFAILYALRARTQFDLWKDAAKFAAAVAVIALLIARPERPLGGATFAMLYVLLPLVLLRGVQSWPPAEFFPRIFIAALAAMELLQAYPVAGSQLVVGASPFLLWAFVCMHDGLTRLLQRLATQKRSPPHLIETPVSAIAALVSVVIIAAMFATGRLRSAYPFPASSLPGSSSLHPPPELEVHLELISKAIQMNCGILFTMPGMGGFNFWSGVPTPDGFNEDNWPKGEPLNDQQHTLEVLQRNPSACVIVQPAALPVWGLPEAGIDTLPLARYILRNMPVVFREPGQWGVEIRVSPDRRTPWRQPSSSNDAASQSHT